MSKKNLDERKKVLPRYWEDARFGLGQKMPHWWGFAGTRRMRIANGFWRTGTNWMKANRVCPGQRKFACRPRLHGCLRLAASIPPLPPGEGRVRAASLFGELKNPMVNLRRALPRPGRASRPLPGHRIHAREKQRLAGSCNAWRWRRHKILWVWMNTALDYWKYVLDNYEARYKIFRRVVEFVIQEKKR